MIRTKTTRSSWAHRRRCTCTTSRRRLSRFGTWKSSRGSMPSGSQHRGRRASRATRGSSSSRRATPAKRSSRTSGRWRRAAARRGVRMRPRTRMRMRTGLSMRDLLHPRSQRRTRTIQPRYVRLHGSHVVVLIGFHTTGVRFPLVRRRDVRRPPHELYRRVRVRCPPSPCPPDL